MSLLLNSVKANNHKNNKHESLKGSKDSGKETKKKERSLIFWCRALSQDCWLIGYYKHPHMKKSEALPQFMTEKKEMHEKDITKYISEKKCFIYSYQKFANCILILR